MDNQLLSGTVKVVLDKDSIYTLAVSLAIAGMVIVFMWGLMKKAG
jgi:hypothetical protein